MGEQRAGLTPNYGGRFHGRIEKVAIRFGRTMSYAIHAPAPGPLSDRQQQLLDFVKATIAQRGCWPTHEEMRLHMGWKVGTSVTDCLYRLCWRGVVKASWQRHLRVWELVETKGNMGRGPQVSEETSQSSG